MRGQEFSIVLVDDQKWALESIAQSLRNHPGVREVICVRQEDTYLKAMSEDIRLAIIDVELPSVSGADGIELARLTRSMYPGVKLLSMSFNTHSSVLRRLFNDVGIDGFIDKNDAGLGSWSLAVEVVMAGGIFASPKIKGKVRRVLAIDDLTPRESEVLSLIAMGHKNLRIAKDLNIALKTVDNHRQNIYRKLNCNSTADATAIYLRNRYLYQEEAEEMPNFRRFNSSED